MPKPDIMAIREKIFVAITRGEQAKSRLLSLLDSCVAGAVIDKRDSELVTLAILEYSLAKEAAQSAADAMTGLVERKDDV